ncbi:MAG: primosomal protein DnaI [Bacilli bacterium]|jgi:primosomal protein DnaI
MKKVKQAINLNQDKQDLLLEYSKAVKDDKFKKLVKTISLSEDELIKYTSKLQTAAIELDHCLNCENLCSCKNEVKGYKYTPEVINGSLTFSYNACPYLQKDLQENSYQNNLYYFDIPKEIRNAKMSEIYPSDKKRLDVIEYLTDFIDKYPKVEKGLYLNGNFGSGKTYLISAMFNEMAKKNIKGAIIYFPEFLRSLKASFDNNYADKFNYIKKVELLLIDDIGAENLTAWARDEILGSLLQYRMQEGLLTFFTSNMSILELEKHLSLTTNGVDKIKAKRIIERIQQLTTEKTLISKNYRQ